MTGASSPTGEIVKRAIALLLFLSALGAAGQVSPSVTPPSRYATVFGAKLHYYDVGSGPVVVLIHGLADEAGIWADSIAPLQASGYRVIVPDLIGFGRSDKPLLGYRTATFTDFLQALLLKLNVDKAVLVGNSLGGWVAADYALRYPQQVSALVLVDAVGYSDLPRKMPLPVEHLRLASLEQARAVVPFAFYDTVTWGTEQVIHGLLEQRVVNNDGFTIDQFIASVRRGDDALDGRLQKIAVPVLVIWGEADRLVPISEGRRLRNDIRGAQLKVIPRCGHMPQLECPARFNPLVVEFLAQLRRQSLAGPGDSPAATHP